MAVLPRALLTEDATPLFVRIAAQLLTDVRQEGAQAGDRLPSERVLAGRYAVSRDTLRAALLELQRRGVLASQAARGWYVAAPGPSSDGDGDGEPPPRSVLGFADGAAATGLVASTRVLGTGVRPATLAEAETLRVAPGSDLYELRRLRFLDGLVVVVEHNRLPLGLCPALATTDFEHASLYATLRAARPAQQPSVADYSVEARQATAPEQALLEIDASVPLLVATQLAYNQDGRPLELTIAAYRGDRYRFKASISNR